MVTYSAKVLELFGAPRLADLTICGAQPVPKLLSYLDKALLNYIAGIQYSDPSIFHIELVFLRRAENAIEEYELGRARLSEFVEHRSNGKHHLRAYRSCLTHFEQCVSSLWAARELIDRLEKRLLRIAETRLTIFKSGDGSSLERISKLNNVAKHFSAAQAEQGSSPVWITNEGLECEDVIVTFHDLEENLEALRQIAHQVFVTIPAEARKKSRRSQGTTPKSNQPPKNI